MVNHKKLDLNASHLVGNYFYTNKDKTEFSSPPANYIFKSKEDSNDDISRLTCNSYGCNNQVKVSTKGNNQYAWYYLENISNSYMAITIERRWVYNNQSRKDIVRHLLYPMQLKEVFSFPWNQKPKCCIIACNIE